MKYGNELWGTEVKGRIITPRPKRKATKREKKTSRPEGGINREKETDARKIRKIACSMKTIHPQMKTIRDKIK